MMYSYKTKGTCSRQIDVELDGNLQGISAIVRGKSVEEVEKAFSGIKCGFKNTSCPDQLVCALKEAKAHEGK